MTCNCKTYCKESLYTALRHLRKQGLYYDDDDCRHDIKELDDGDAYRIHDVMEKLSNGYILVPIEPTEKMHKAAYEIDMEIKYDNKGIYLYSEPTSVRRYKAMIQAALEKE